MFGVEVDAFAVDECGEGIGGDFEGVSGGDDEVGFLADFDGAERIAEAEDLCSVKGDCFNCFVDG